MTNGRRVKRTRWLTNPLEASRGQGRRRHWRVEAGGVATALAAPTEEAIVVRDQAFYVDGAAYRTVLTPGALPARAPAHSFDVL